MHVRPLAWIVPAFLVVPAAAAAASPECTAARQRRSAHVAGCRDLETDCRRGDAGACRKASASCGMLDDARLVDAVYAACGAPSVPPAAPEPVAKAAPKEAKGQAAQAARRPAPSAEPPPSGVHVYGRPGCSLTRRVCAELSAAGIAYTEHNVDRDPDARAVLDRNAGFLKRKMLPLLIVNGRPTMFDHGNVGAACSM